MKKTILIAAIALLGASVHHVRAFSVPFEVFLGTGDTVVNSTGGTPFTGFLTIGSFDIGVNVNTADLATLSSGFNPFNNGLTYFNGAPIAPGSPISISAGVFPDQQGLKADFINDATDGAVYAGSWDNDSIYAFITDTATVSSASQWGLFQTNKFFKDLSVFVPSGNPEAGIPVSMSVDTAGNFAQVRDAGVTVVPEPASALLLLGGLGVLATRRRRA